MQLIFSAKRKKGTCALKSDIIVCFDENEMMHSGNITTFYFLVFLAKLFTVFFQSSIFFILNLTLITERKG